MTLSDAKVAKGEFKDGEDVYDWWSTDEGKFHVKRRRTMRLGEYDIIGKVETPVQRLVVKIGMRLRLGSSEYILAQCAPCTVVAICLGGGQRWNNGGEVRNPMNIQVKELCTILGTYWEEWEVL